MHPKRDGRGQIVMPDAEFEQLLELAAERGARKALVDVGLDGEDAASDIRDLRSLLAACGLPGTPRCRPPCG